MKKWSLLFLGLVCSGATFAAGFEKTVIWSGEHAGTANAAASSVDSSEALFFNPAGLAGVENGDVSLNFSPIFSTFEGPVLAAALDPGDGIYESEKSFAPIFGLTGAYRLNNRIVLGLGAFVSGGVNTVYDIDGNTEDIVGNLALMDFSLGLGYQATEHLRLGVAWRATWAKAKLSTATPAGVLTLDGMEKWDFTGVRAGAQYIVPEKFGLGLSVRSPVTLKMTGGEAKTNPNLGSDTDASLESTLPLQVVAGAHFHASPDWAWFAQMDWTNYANNKALEVDATIAALGGALSDIDLSWNDQLVLRLGTAYDLSDAWTVRGGYALTSQVTNENKAKATFSTPGIAHTLNLGVGTSLGGIALNAALDYSWAKSEGSDLAAGVGKEDYSVSAYGAHLGATYHF